MTSDSVTELLTSAGKPLKLPEVVKLAKSSGFSVSKKELSTLLESLVAEGRLFTLSLGAKSPLGYTPTPPLKLAILRLEELLPTLATPLAPAKLRAKLPAPLRPHFDEALGVLLERGDAHYLPKGATRRVLNRPPRPSDALTPAHLTTLKTILARATRFAKQPLTVDALVEWLDTPHAATQLLPQPGKAARTPSSAEFRLWYDDASRQTSSRMVSVLDTWKHFREWSEQQGSPPEPAKFRESMGQLYEKGLIFLEPPERPQDLKPEEQLLLVPQRLGPPALRWCWTNADA